MQPLVRLWQQHAKFSTESENSDHEPYLSLDSDFLLLFKPFELCLLLRLCSLSLYLLLMLELLQPGGSFFALFFSERLQLESSIVSLLLLLFARHVRFTDSQATHCVSSGSGSGTRP
eukprot:SAG22_NODE_596_length_8727_cov_107.360338_6_plen_117_part_00